jgi:hypothetical protein
VTSNRRFTKEWEHTPLDCVYARLGLQVTRGWLVTQGTARVAALLDFASGQRQAMSLLGQLRSVEMDANIVDRSPYPKHLLDIWVLDC